MAFVNPYLEYLNIDEQSACADEDEDFEVEDFVNSEQSVCTKRRRIVRSIPRYTEYRALGHFKRIRRDPLMGWCRMVQQKTITERAYNLEPLDKVFCSQWLNSRTVVFGTKCNQLRLLNTDDGSLLNIGNLESSPNTHCPPLDDLCGIHAIEINPSGSLMVTGARNPNDTAVFSLPDVTPVCVGEGAHRDWIFDIKWLDDTHYVSGGRDMKIALWEVNENRRLTNPHSDYVRGLRNESSTYYHMLAKTHVSNAEDKIRALTFDRERDSLLALTLSAHLQMWDTQTFTLMNNESLIFDKENVCIASHERMAAVGSKSNITFVDSTSLRRIKFVHAPKPNCGIRSLSFNNHIVTIGTGQSSVIFLDCRMFKFLPSEGSTIGEKADLVCSPGWMAPFDSVIADEYNPAIYTHCYDPSGLKLFTAGGPLPASMKGAYAALWL